MENLGWVCSYCSAHAAVTFCECSSQGVQLCPNCVPKHLTLLSQQSHSLHPISLFPYRAVPGYLESVAKREKDLGAACNSLQNSVKAIDECIRQLQRKAEEITNAVREYARSETEKLVTLKAKLQSEIDQAAEEVRGKLHQDSLPLSSKYSPLLWATIQGRTPPALFHYELKSCEPAYIQSVIYVQFSCADDSELSIPLVFGDRVNWYNVYTGQATSVALPMALDSHAVFCQYDVHSVLCAGGHPANTSVFTLNLQSLSLRAEQPMACARNNPGIISHNSFVYVFGGYTPNLTIKSCEKFDRKERKWNALADMCKPRSHFTPCEYQNSIYLPYVQGSNTCIEYFDTVTEQFQNFPVSTKSLRGSSVSFVINDTLIILAQNCEFGTWKIGKEAEFTVKPLAKALVNTNSVIAVSPPVAKDHRAYYPRYGDGAVMTFDLELMTLTE